MNGGSADSRTFAGILRVLTMIVDFRRFHPVATNEHLRQFQRRSALRKPLPWDAESPQQREVQIGHRGVSTAAAALTSGN